MKRLVSPILAILFFFAIGYGNVFAQAVPIQPNFGCSQIMCDVLYVTVVTKCFTVNDCANLTSAQIQSYIDGVKDVLCDRVQACCEENQCDTQVDCDIVQQDSSCPDNNTLCVRVKIEFKCNS